MSLRRILSDAFAGGRPVTTANTIGALLDEIKRLAGGSRRAAGRASGIGESTLRGWDRGSRPRNPASAITKLSTGIRRLLRTDPAGGLITVRITNPGKGPRTRNVPVDPEGVRRAGEAWERGDEAGMVREFRRAVTDDWYRTRLFRPQDDDPTDDDDNSGEQMADEPSSEPAVGGVSW